nr:peptidoglycan DD-metalloendopeptidase family protein [bacterium]
LAFIQRTDKSSQRIENLTAKTKSSQNLNSGDLNNIPPLRGRIVNSFGKVWDAKLRNWIYNKGVTVQAGYASNVSAINDGVVMYTGWIPVYGRVLIIDHQNGLFSIYGHLSKIFFEVGDKVKKGSIIAHSGDSGSVDSPALYFGLRDTTNDIDPTPLFY